MSRELRLARYLGKRAADMARAPGDLLPGGLADNKRPADFALPKLQAGRKVEREHTSDKGLATEIAMDHILENPDYYSKLERMENGE